MKKIIFSLIILLVFSCQKKNTKKQSIDLIKIDRELTSKDSIFSNDINFINDSILKSKFKLDISKYEILNKKNSCFPERISKKVIKEFYNEDFENLGDLNNDKKEDYVFYLPYLNSCEKGDSYYFTDNSIPRIETESNCCHSKSIFSIGDIDEDGGNEIAQYYSSCASSFKRIYIWTLKNNKWKNVADFTFKLNDEYKIFEDFHKLHKKTAKGKFKFLEIYDINSEGKLLKKWKTIIMK